MIYCDILNHSLCLVISLSQEHKLIFVDFENHNYNISKNPFFNQLWMFILPFLTFPWICSIWSLGGTQSTLIDHKRDSLPFFLLCSDSESEWILRTLFSYFPASGAQTNNAILRVIVRKKCTSCVGFFIQFWFLFIISPYLTFPWINCRIWSWEIDYDLRVSFSFPSFVLTQRLSSVNKCIYLHECFSLSFYWSQQDRLPLFLFFLA